MSCCTLDVAFHVPVENRKGNGKVVLPVTNSFCWYYFPFKGFWTLFIYTWDFRTKPAIQTFCMVTYFWLYAEFICNAHLFIYLMNECTLTPQKTMKQKNGTVKCFLQYLWKGAHNSGTRNSHQMVRFYLFNIFLCCLSLTNMDTQDSLHK